ncbi:hypothetical protein C8Q77DRAFT_1059205 [Trametes polyzona]|nr:hypothetical protein C8Q77DRAFT_1059205 [Trametes polyzona]
MLAVTVTIKSHVACALRESPGHTTEQGLYQALFLDCITALWSYECYLRAGTAEWSPMPWSRTSLRELDGATLIPEPPSYRTPTLSNDDLAEEDGAAVRAARAVFGSPLDIPWFGASHDGYPFCSTLSSYTKIRRNGYIQTLHADAALWLSAMTFGLLEAITRARILESMLLVPGEREGERVISGTRILQFLVHWHHHMHHHRPHSDHEAHLQHGREVALILDRALNALDEEEWQNASIFLRAGYLTTDVTDVVCAVALTVTPLCHAAQSIWGADELPEIAHVMHRVQNKIRNFYTAALGSCEKRMYRAGWCPNTISHVFMSTLWGLPIVSNLVRLRPYIRNSPDEHRGCTEDRCQFYHFDEKKEYVVRHVDPSCRCAFVRPPLHEVEALLSAGVVPAVVYAGGELRVQVATGGSYVTISHVWADGMGSTTEDGLPGCVVERIAGLVQWTYPDSDGAFWMDSLCVPAVETLRKDAILLMGKTYRDSAKVLVVDECIRTQCSESKSWEENLFRIATSGWIRRVWTLQEAILARELYFEFIEGPVDVEQRLGLKSSESADSDNSIPRNESLDFLPSNSLPSHVPVLAFRERIRHDGIAAQDLHLPLDQVIRLLRLRTTTKPKDELVAVSCLLRGINLDELLKINGNDAAQLRIRAFLLQQRSVSTELPVQLTPRINLPERGFAWAPRTLVSAIEGASLKSGTGVCTPEGLIADYTLAPFERPVSIPESCRTRGEKAELSILINHRATMAT